MAILRYEGSSVVHSASGRLYGWSNQGFHYRGAWFLVGMSDSNHSKRKQLPVYKVGQCIYTVLQPASLISEVFALILVDLHLVYSTSPEAVDRSRTASNVRLLGSVCLVENCQQDRPSH